MNSIVRSAQASHPNRFVRQLLSAETEYQRACGVFGHDSAEAKAAWYEWQGMRRIMRASAQIS